MELPNNNTIVELSIELNELKNKFQESVLRGKSSVDSRALYLKIEEVKCHLKTLQWDGN